MPRQIFWSPAEIRGHLHDSLAPYLGESRNLSHLARTARPLVFKHGEQLWTKGEIGTLAWVVKGAIELVVDRLVVDTIGPGTFLGVSSLWGVPHGLDARARRTGPQELSQVILWDTDKSETRELFCSVDLLRVLLDDAHHSIQYLRETQALYRGKRTAAAHVAWHIRRLIETQPDLEEFEICQWDLAARAGYDERTIRLALGQLTKACCVRQSRRSVYHIDMDALTDFIDGRTAGAEDVLGAEVFDNPSDSLPPPEG